MSRQRHQQFSVSCRPSDWKEIGRRAKAAKMTISRFVVACVLEEEMGWTPPAP